MFDPSKHKPDPNGGGGDYINKPGSYCVAWTKLRKRGETNAGKEFIEFLGEVIVDSTGSGQKGRKFTERVFVTEAAYERLGAMCASMGFNQPLDLQDSAAVRRAWLYTPFKAKFEMEKVGSKSYSRLRYYETEISDAEREAMDAWVADQAALGKGVGDFDDDDDAPPPPSDDDYRGGADDGEGDGFNF